ncbi:MAG: hypothetical protein KatS3mg012_1737 [Gaiellaceae bacterium]|nr:MAG: hypothetical protein KatS3mg012_1737 [Gaiellaceae bacterium]
MTESASSSPVSGRLDRVWPAAVWAGAAVYAAALLAESISAHRQFGTGFDTAIYDQLLWLIANGHEPFSTIVSRPMLADHFQPGLVAFVPLYWLGGGIEALLLVQTLALALAAPALYTLARSFGALPALAALPALLWLVCPFVARINLWEFRPTALLPALLVLAVLAATQGRLVLFWTTTLIALSLKEDVAATYVMLGLLLAWFGRRRLGAAVVGISAAWLVLATVVMRAGGDSLEAFGRRFAGERGDDMLEAILWMALHPLETAGDLVRESLAGLMLLLVSTAGLALLAPAWILLAAPTALHNALSAYEPQHLLTFHYHQTTLSALFIAAAVGVCRARELERLSRLALAAGLGVALALAFVGGLWAHGRWTEGVRLPGEQTRRALDVIPPEAAVSASPHLLPSLSRRTEIYVLPEPFIPLDTGSPLSAEAFAERAERVRYVAFLRGDLPEEFPGEDGEIDRLLVHGGFREIARAGLVSVYARD